MSITFDSGTVITKDWLNDTDALVYDVFNGASTALLARNALGASSGIWGVALGGTGRATATAYSVLCGGTTATGAHQSVAAVGNSGQVLTSNGAGALPTFQTPLSGWTFVAKTATETVTGSTTLQDDDELFFSLDGSSTYHYKLVLNIQTNGTADFKFRLTGGTPSNDMYMLSFADAGSAATTRAGQITTTEAVTTTGSLIIATVEGLFTAGGTGPLKLQWAQNTSDPVNTKVMKGSFFQYRIVTA